MNSLSGPNLFNLADHLRDLESGLTTILFETVLKLSSLTDTSIFLLVETPEGRKFGGRRHLCDAYGGASGLKSLANDVECSVDVAASTLTERFAPKGFQPRQSVGRSTSTLHSFAPPPPLINGTSTRPVPNPPTSKRKQSRPQSLTRQALGSLESPSDPKRSKLDVDVPIRPNVSHRRVSGTGAFNGDVGVSNGGGGGSSGYEPATFFKVAQFPDGVANFGGDGVGGGGGPSEISSSHVVKREADDSALFGSNNPVEISLDDEDFGKSFVDEGVPGVLEGSFGKLPTNGIPSDGVLMEFANEMDALAIPWSIKDYLDQNVKASAMMGMEAPIVDTSLEIERHSTFMKLLSSILYDSSKETAMACPVKMKSHPFSKKFFSAAYEEWFSYFTNLTELHAKGFRCLEGSRSYSVKTFCRNVMQRSFGYFLDRMK